MRPVGEAREETVDVRILSATHKNLADLVAQGLFREDLFYRINVIELRVPALRERSTDVREIAEAILERLARRANGPSPGISDEAVRMLEAYPFPGNVRELENVLERALTLSTDGFITPEHIRLRVASRAPALETPTAVTAIDGNTALGSQLESIERDAIVKALEQTRYNKTAAAKLLGMFAAGVPLVEALDSVAGATGNIVYENAVLKMRDEVSTGQRLQRAMENTGLFPNMWGGSRRLVAIFDPTTLQLKALLRTDVG